MTSVSAQDMRAVWRDAWGSGFKTPGQTAQLVDFAERHGFNAVFIEVRKRGDAYYNSSIEPRASDRGNVAGRLPDEIHPGAERHADHRLPSSNLRFESM